MWRSAENSFQKKAILEQLIPLTKDDYIDAVIAFSEDDDPAIRDDAFGRLRITDPADLMRRLGGAVELRTVRALMRYCLADPHPGLLARLVGSRRVSWELVAELWKRPQDDLWRALIANKGFVILSHARRDEVTAFLAGFNTALADQYREQAGWVTAKDIADYDRQAPAPEPAPAPPKPAAPVPPAGGPSDRLVIKGVDTLFEAEGDTSGESTDAFVAEGQSFDVSGALFGTGKGVVTEEDEVIDLDTVELDVPDFMLTDKAFEGLSKEQAALNRRKISEILNTLSTPQLVKLATVGNMEVRKILIKDMRRIVAMAVLSNGGITPMEIAGLAGNPMTMQDVVEHISNNRVLSKSYVVKFALVMNPKTPIKVGMRYVEVMRRGDVKRVVENKNISPILRNMAKKRMI